MVSIKHENNPMSLDAIKEQYLKLDGTGAKASREVLAKAVIILPENEGTLQAILANNIDVENAYKPPEPVPTTDFRQVFRNMWDWAAEKGSLGMKFGAEIIERISKALGSFNQAAEASASDVVVQQPEVDEPQDVIERQACEAVLAELSKLTGKKDANFQNKINVASPKELGPIFDSLHDMLAVEKRRQATKVPDDPLLSESLQKKELCCISTVWEI